jgi:hypothetical protein
MYEFKEQSADGESVVVLDLEKVCLVRVETEAGHHYPKVAIRFVDGHEDDDVVPKEYALHLLEAYRAYLAGATK